MYHVEIMHAGAPIGGKVVQLAGVRDVWAALFGFVYGISARWRGRLHRVATLLVFQVCCLLRAVWKLATNPAIYVTAIKHCTPRLPIVRTLAANDTTRRLLPPGGLVDSISTHHFSPLFTPYPIEGLRLDPLEQIAQWLPIRLEQDISDVVFFHPTKCQTHVNGREVVACLFQRRVTTLELECWSARSWWGDGWFPHAGEEMHGLNWSVFFHSLFRTQDDDGNFSSSSSSSTTMDGCMECRTVQYLWLIPRKLGVRVNMWLRLVFFSEPRFWCAERLRFSGWGRGIQTCLFAVLCCLFGGLVLVGG